MTGQQPHCRHNDVTFKLLFLSGFDWSHSCGNMQLQLQHPPPGGQLWYFNDQII